MTRHALCIAAVALTCVLGGAAHARGAALKKGPYLLYDDVRTAMSVLWQTDATAASSTLEWGTTPGLGNGPYTVTEFGDHQYRYEITGLAPGSRCYYRVEVDGDARSGSFHSAAPDGDTEIVLYAYGDTRDDPEVQNEVLRKVLDDMSEDADTRQTLLLHVGDLVHDGTDEGQWQQQHFNPAYFGIRRSHSELPIMVVRGNHETPDDTLRKYYPFSYEAPNYYSFDYGPIHFTVIDSDVDRDPGSDQYDWIDADLTATTQPWLVTLWHKPAYGARTSLLNDPANQVITDNLLEPHGVHLVLAGHHHHYARCEKNELPHITTGGGGAPLYDIYDTSPYFVAGLMAYHYCRIAIKGNTLQFTAYDLDGQVIDEFFVHKGTDLQGPGLDRVHAGRDSVHVRIEFDECVEAGNGPHGAENPANYSLPGFPITDATIDDAKRRVELTLGARLGAGATYSMTVQNVNDCADSPNTMATPASFDFEFLEGPGRLIENNDQWRYVRGDQDPGADWFDPDADVSAWLEGRSGFGYADRDDVTVLDDMPSAYSTVFVRRSFDLCNALAVRDLALDVDYDDGFAAYLNGIRVGGRNDANFTGHNHTALASDSHEAGTPESLDLSSQLGVLQGGENLLAIALMNVSLADDDASLIPELRLTGGYCADIAPPGETGTGPNLVDQLRWIDDSTLTWGPNVDASGGYRVYRGEFDQLPGLTSAVDDSCLRWTSVYSDRTTASDIAEEPMESEGGLYWYLVTGNNSFGEGSGGAGEPGERVLNSSGDCPEHP